MAVVQDQRLLEAAVDIGHRLVRDAVWEAEACTWSTPRAAPSGGVPASGTPVGPTLHLGSAGIGLFLARLASYSRDAGHKKTAIGAVRNALRDAWDPSVNGSGVSMKTSTDWRFGFYLGVLGIVWAAREAGALLKDRRLVDEARARFERLALTADEPYEDDLLFGAAGAIPLLLHLAETGWPDAAPLAARLGDRLLRNARVHDGAWSWAPPSSRPQHPPLSGWSHGASGIGWALAALYGDTRNPRFKEASLGAFQYERSIFDAAAQNWPDFLQSPDAQGRRAGRVTWCHGAPGIGLARAQSYPILRDGRLREEAVIAAETTRRKIAELSRVPRAILPLCCGVAGLAECVWIIEAGLGIGDAGRGAKAIGLAGVQVYGDGSWPTGFPGSGDPSLMQGVAGIGHFLLRLHDPVGVPTVLVPPSAAPRRTSTRLAGQRAAGAGIS